MNSELNSAARRYLSAEASALKPVVMLGKEGATPQVVFALNEALDAHELVKLRFIGFKEDRKTIARELAEEAGAALVRIIGNVAVFYRPAEDRQKRRYTLPG